MDVLTFLKKIRAEKLELRHLEEQRATLRESLLPAAIQYDRDKVQTSPSDHMLEVAANLSDIDERMVAQISKLTSHVKLAYEIIMEIQTPEYRQLLELRYLSDNNKRAPKQWYEVADELGYSLDHVKGKLHGNAIREARDIWNKREHAGTRL